MNALAQIAERLGPLIGKLGSPHDGEVVSAARALGRILDKQGFTFNDMSIALLAEPVTRIIYRNPEPEPAANWREIADWCADRPEWLSDKEADFIKNMLCTLSWPGTEPTPKQAKWLQDIWVRIREEMVA